MKFNSCLALGAILGSASVALAGGPQILINEVDADTVGTDDMEFIELYDGGVGNTSLTGLVVVLYNGSDDQSYNDAIDLDGFSTDANGFFVIGSELVPNVDLVAFTTNGVQNGADAVALYTGDAGDFPNDTPITLVGLLDAIVYDTNDGDDAGLAVLINAGQPQVNEGGNGNSSADSNQRCPDGAGGALNTDMYGQGAPTPGAPNLCVIPMGACCNLETGMCTDGATQGECSGPYDIWTVDVLCAELDPACAAEPIGACCDPGSGICTDGVLESDCLTSNGLFGGDGSECASIKCTGAEASNVIISEIVDATLPGGQPKFVELTNCDTVTVDLSLYSIGNYNNGGTSLGGGSSTSLNGMLAPGETYVYCFSSDEDTTFVDVYGFAPDQYAGGGFINGDDVVALFLGTATGDGSDAVLVDIYGVIGVDGSGTTWEYTDGYSYRNSGASATDTFNEAEWTIGGANSLETGDDAEELLLILELTTPGEHSCDGGSGGDCPEDLDMSGDVGFGDLLAILSAWGPCAACAEDLDMSGDVGFGDLLAVLSAWGACP